MAGQFCLRFRLPRKSQGFFTCRKSATWGKRLYFPSEGRHVEDFFARKNPTASTGFESAISGTRGQLYALIDAHDNLFPSVTLRLTGQLRVSVSEPIPSTFNLGLYIFRIYHTAILSWSSSERCPRGPNQNAPRISHLLHPTSLLSLWQVIPISPSLQYKSISVDHKISIFLLAEMLAYYLPRISEHYSVILFLSYLQNKSDMDREDYSVNYFWKNYNYFLLMDWNTVYSFLKINKK
jgi:hypothetical protein